MFKVPKENEIKEIEVKVLELWKKNKIFEKSVEQRSEDNLYVFYDGPPFISGLPHYGHLLGSIAKDVVPRYWTMKGKRVERVWGWDAHGLTVENKVQKKLGIKNRRDIEKYGLEKFINACYDYTSEVSAEWEWYIDRIGRWVDMEHAYKTIDQNYMESVIWAFKQLWEKKYIYEGVYTSLYCTTCGTPVSHFEIAMDNTYMDFEDPSITIKFKVSSKGKFKDINLLAWTTTPWTLPSNRALVVDEKENYVLVESGGEKYILAEKRLEAVFKDRKYKLLEVLLGKELLGLSYEPPYRFYAFKPQEFKVYAFEGMVNMDDGTGIVHSAPGFGEIDTDMGRYYDISLMLSLDDEGKLVPGTNGENLFAGIFYAKANPLIKEDLEQKGFVFDYTTAVHRVPFHDRCNTVLIQRAQNSWFVNVKDIKEAAIKANEPINWVPAHLKEGRFKIGLVQAPEWCISRERFWATPMPVWEASDGDKIVIGSIKELEELSGKKVKNLHRPFIDEITIVKNNKTYKRIPEVLDSWFEAGSMPYAQIHYPFENQKKFEKNFPGDYIVEYIAQTRAWFFFMHVLSTALFETNSFKNVITTGVMAGNDGRKMSKSYNNYADPKQVLETIGGDALRLYLMNSPLMVGDNANFDEVELKNKLKNVLNPLWNSIKYFLIYSEYHEWKPSATPKLETLDNILDKWIFVRLNQTIKEIAVNMEGYVIPPAAEAIENFIDDLSRWYVRRSRERISSGNDQALNTLFYVLLEFSKAAAPIIPFLTEEIYQCVLPGIKNKKESVHLETFPNYDERVIENGQEILSNMKIARDLVSAALGVRVTNKIAVRQPLAELFTTENYSLPTIYNEIVMDEVNVKKVTAVKSLNKLPDEAKDVNKIIALDLKITKELKQEGDLRDFIRKFQDLRKKQDLNINDRIEATYLDTKDYNVLVERFGVQIKDKIYADSLKSGSAFEIIKSK